MWKVWITAFENVDFTYFSTFLPVENTQLNFVKYFFVIKSGNFCSNFNKSLCKTEFKKSLTRTL